MARDVHDFFEPETTWSQSQRSDGSWTTPSDAVYDRHTTHTGRDDSTPTGLVKGRYVHNTEYWAHYCYSTSRPGEMNAKRTLGGAAVRRWWTGVGDNVYVTWGLDVSKQRPGMGAGVESRAHSNVIAALKSGALDVFTNVGEAREAGNMLQGVLRTAMKGIKSFLRSIRKFRGSPKAIAQAYLAWIFGIKPLAVQAYTIGQFICDQLGDAPVGVVKGVAIDTDYSLPPPVNLTSGRIKTFDGEVKRGVEVGHTFKVTHPEYFELWRYGVSTPWTTAWELMSLSFVIDWFTGLGAFLEGLQKPLGLQHLDGYVTYFLENKFGANIPKRDAGWTYVSGDEYGRVDFRSKAMQRYPLALFATPAPYLDLGLNPSQLLSGFALLAARAPR